LDRLTHGQNVIGKTCMCVNIHFTAFEGLDLLQRKRQRLVPFALAIKILKSLVRLKSASLVSLSRHRFRFHCFSKNWIQIDLVTCRFNNCVYVRKSIEKISAQRTREVCDSHYLID
jgi:hypothetical protein